MAVSTFLIIFLLSDIWTVSNLLLLRLINTPVSIFVLNTFLSLGLQIHPQRRLSYGAKGKNHSEPLAVLTNIFSERTEPVSTTTGHAGAALER